MRILFNDECGDISVLEVHFASYCENLVHKDANGKRCVGEGLYITDYDGDAWVLPGATLSDCTDIITRLYADGCYNFLGRPFQNQIFPDCDESDED